MDELEREEAEAENAIEDEGVENEDVFNFSKLQLSEEVKGSEVMHYYASMSSKILLTSYLFTVTSKAKLQTSMDDYFAWWLK